MSKRKITQQQALRIKAMQQKRLQKANTNMLIADAELGPEETGLILTHHGKYVDVEADDGAIIRCHIRQHLGAFIAGDKIVWRRNLRIEGGVVTALLPRTSLIWRPDDRNTIKPIAANVTQIVIVCALEPKPTWTLIDSYLVAANIWQIPAIVVLNKIDLKSEDTCSVIEIFENYQKIGYTIYQVSAEQSETLIKLAEQLTNQSNIFVGQSGVGKSSLINQFIPNANARTGVLSLQKNHGAHTTTQSHYYHLPQGGAILDSPGIRAMNLTNFTKEQIQTGFIELLPFLGLCKFRNCSHQQEEGCALLDALENGEISEQRFKSFLGLLESSLRA